MKIGNYTHSGRSTSDTYLSPFHANKREKEVVGHPLPTSAASVTLWYANKRQLE